MPKYSVSYSEDHLYRVEVEADSLEEAEEMVNSGNFNDSKSSEMGVEFLGVNDVEEIKE